jgi:hypothetical protein
MLRESPETATNVIKAALPDYPIHKVKEVELEFIPGNNESLIGDKSAMDAIIKFEDEAGKRGFIAVETKYSENLGTNVAYDRDDEGNKIPRKQTLKAVEELCRFMPDVEQRIMTGDTPLTQIYRNFLLSEMYGYKEGLLSYSIILAPKKHPATINELESLAGGLRAEYKERIKSVDLESFVDAIIHNCPDKYRMVFERFYDRYLNFAKLKKY